MKNILWVLAAVVVLSTGDQRDLSAREPIADVPFVQEYRDPFIQTGKPKENDVRGVAVDKQGRVWAATAAGLRLIHGDASTTGENIDGPAYDVTVDPDGIVWVGAWNGLYQLSGKRLTREAGLEGPVTVVLSSGNRLLAANTTGVFERFDKKWKLIPGPWATNILDLAIADGDLYVAAWSGLYQKRGERIDWLSKPSQTLSRNMRALAVAPDGRLWIGSRGGIDIYNKGRRERSLTHKDGLPSRDIRSLAFDGTGRLWIGTALGAVRYNGKSWSLRHGPRWLPNDEVRDVAFSPDGTAWVATRNGISPIRKREMTLASKAKFFDQLVRDRHVRAPGLVERCRLPVPGDISKFEPMDTDNDGLFTGLYLATESYRYAVTGAADAKANATEAYRAMEFLQTVTDTPGFVARTVIPVDWRSMADANRTYTEQEVADHRSRESRWKNVEKRWRKSADGKWQWKGDTSSDETSGHYFSYAVYYDLVADEQEKQRVAKHVKRITDYIIDGGYVFRDIDGKATRWGVWSPEKLNDDPNWWLERGGNSVEILAYLTITRHMTGDQKYDREIETLLTKHHYAKNILTPMQPGTDYFTYIGYQLQALCYPALLTYEKNPQRRALYLKSMQNWFAPVRKDGSPLYGFVFASLAKGNFRQQQCAELLRDIPLDMVQYTINNSQREDVKIVGRPAESRRQTNRLLPASERSVFRWDRNVYEADRGSSGHWESSSVYWLLPYWMGRHHGLIAAP